MKKIFLNFKKFEKIVKLGFFTSRGGVSKGNFYSLNCNKYSADNRNNVLENISIAKKIPITNLLVNS